MICPFKPPFRAGISQLAMLSKGIHLLPSNVNQDQTKTGHGVTVRASVFHRARIRSLLVHASVIMCIVCLFFLLRFLLLLVYLSYYCPFIQSMDIFLLLDIYLCVYDHVELI